MKRALEILRYAMLALGIFLASISARAEELDIPFASALREPLIELFFPPPNSPDRVGFTREGMLIQQRPDAAGRTTADIGFKTLLPASGDFTVTLDLKCLRLEEPSGGWGQGLILAVYLDDEQQTILELARLACPDRGQFCHVKIEHLRGNEAPIYRDHKMDFTEGSFVIARSGEQVTFTVDNGQGAQLLETFPCPTSDLRGVELGCTRQEKGNTTAEFLLKRLHINANRFFSYQRPKKPWLTWWKVAVAAQVIVVGGLLLALSRRNRP